MPSDLESEIARLRGAGFDVRMEKGSVVAGTFPLADDESMVLPDGRKLVARRRAFVVAPMGDDEWELSITNGLEKIPDSRHASLGAAVDCVMSLLVCGGNESTNEKSPPSELDRGLARLLAAGLVARSERGMIVGGASPQDEPLLLPDGRRLVALSDSFAVFVAQGQWVANVSRGSREFPESRFPTLEAAVTFVLNTLAR